MIDCPAVTVVGPPSCSTMTLPLSTSVTSSNCGVWNGSSQFGGAIMWATETPSVPVVTRPTCSSMTLPPGTGMRVGEEMSRGTGPQYPPVRRLPPGSADAVDHERQQVGARALGRDEPGTVERLQGPVEPLRGVGVQREQPLDGPDDGA